MDSWGRVTTSSIGSLPNSVLTGDSEHGTRQREAKAAGVETWAQFLSTPYHCDRPGHLGLSFLTYP